jgi:hypothetical protein
MNIFSKVNPNANLLYGGKFYGTMLEASIAF